MSALRNGQWVRHGWIWRWEGTPTVRRAECGTDSGYYRHRRALGEPACDDCKAAHAAAQRRWKATAA